MCAAIKVTEDRMLRRRIKMTCEGVTSSQQEHGKPQRTGRITIKGHGESRISLPEARGQSSSLRNVWYRPWVALDKSDL